MIERYTRPEMGQLWSLENKFQRWLDVELAACDAWAELGVIPERPRRKFGRRRPSPSSAYWKSKRKCTTTSSRLRRAWPSTSGPPPAISTTA